MILNYASQLSSGTPTEKTRKPSVPKLSRVVASRNRRRDVVMECGFLSLSLIDDSTHRRMEIGEGCCILLQSNLHSEWNRPLTNLPSHHSIEISCLTCKSDSVHVSKTACSVTPTMSASAWGKEHTASECPSTDPPSKPDTATALRSSSPGRCPSPDRVVKYYRQWPFDNASGRYGHSHSDALLRHNGDGSLHRQQALRIRRHCLSRVSRFWI